MKKQVLILAFVLVVVCMASVEAAFIVEPHSSGIGNANFSSIGTPSASTAGTAPGLQATNSVFGGTAVDPDKDTYIFSYSPGTDVDNWTVPAYQYFGNGLYSTNLAGGDTGYYNAYITWPTSTGASSLCDITITNDGADVVWNDISTNDGQTNWIAELWDHDPLAEIYGGNNKWLKIADQILMTAGQTYTVTQAAQNNTYVSMRNAGVMWEFVAVPEPTTLLLLSMGMLTLRRRK